MEDKIYHMFIYNDTILWTALSQMYAHAHHDSRIFELYREIVRASHETLGLFVADYFGFLQSRWEELAQYEPLSDFPATAAAIISQRLARQHTYQFLMGLKSQYESLRIQILNNSPLPSLYEAFAIIDVDECRRRLIQASSTISLGSTPITNQMAFAASSSGGPLSSGVAETSPGHVPDLSHIQSQLGLLQSQLGSLLQQQPSGSTATLATCTPIAFHAKIGHPTWVLDYKINDHMTGQYSCPPRPRCSDLPTNLDGLPRPIPLFDSPSVPVPPASAARAPLKVYTLRAPPSGPLPDSSSVSGTSPSRLVPPSIAPR
ncbi:hypothetical protein Acr_00g0070400 [Actinidia rufa]|uniref:Uncharacterized protein n=1 Tax=Actinidia rufa TaxID=165716 RepID=A0A7J0DR86_9ERIC|nr:hypothetical protein Acr_00g0070400 [Actinidia rufa]